MKTNSEIHIAIADGHPIIRKGIIAILKEYGIHTVAEGCDGIELLKNIATANILPDICILDIQMPRMNGYETIRILNKKWPHIKTIIFTILNNEYNIVKMLSHGANGYILKDSPIDEILNAITEIKSTGFYYSDIEISLFSDQNISGHLNKYYFNEIELQFIIFCCSEYTYKEIACKMNTSLNSIKGYREEIFSRLQLKSRVGLVMFAIKSGIVTF